MYFLLDDSGVHKVIQNGEVSPEKTEPAQSKSPKVRTVIWINVYTFF